MSFFQYYQHIHYCEFIIKNKISFYEFIKTITQPSNTHNKITIVEGWHLYQLNELLDKYFKIYNNLSYLNVIADTYLVNSDPDFNSLQELFQKHKDNLIKKYKNHELLKIYNFDDIIIIASLIEKEGIDDQDKKKISSVIFNRIEKKMKLQIDATVIYSITEGKYKLNRKLSKNDLKIKHEYNTYYIDYLPPGPICYVGTKTIELIFEDYKNKKDYFYYFYDKFKDKHVYSKDYKEHLKKLNEYRKKRK